MKKIVAALSIVFFLVLFYSCSTDFSVTAPYKETMVIYGLLNSSPVDTLQYIRISKAFLGEGNALIMAQQKDSINYGDVLDVKLQQILNGHAIRTVSLRRDTTVEKDNGLFNNPYQVLYKIRRAEIPILQNST